jgi:hypothetical protein
LIQINAGDYDKSIPKKPLAEKLCAHIGKKHFQSLAAFLQHGTGEGDVASSRQKNTTS